MSGDVAEIISAFAPVAREVIQLRQEVRRLRERNTTYNKTISEILQGTPISISQREGRWGYHINCRDATTGGESWDTYDDAVRAAFHRVGDLFIQGPENEED